MLTLNSNTMAAVDIETTGSVVGYHEIIQIAIVPLTPDLDPWDKAPFYMDIRPDFPERGSSRSPAPPRGPSRTRCERTASSWRS